ncbi:MAG TPA: bifunctional homocysteine S-methyltransferase/methylenetetrahydrofolate reductase [Gaiellaceae bacterium]|nr:bifunctional homocysteine S-methyltransferase/methylenetetrahydrofolate reductase [Gaiellaceae bacterium]
MPASFLERLRDGPPIVADGGTGTLISAAAPRLRCPEEANVRAPDTVVSLHVSFINAGAELIETNTFGANRAKLASRYLEEELVRINETAVKLARDARQVAGREVFIAGSIGPLGEHEETWPEDRAPLFAEQARLLAGRGVDLFSVETFFDLEELVTAIEAVRSVSDLPIVAMMTFGDDAETIGGVSAAEAAERLAGLGVAAVGTNHGAGPDAALTALQAMGDSLPLAAMPNIGLASMSGSRIVYPHATPEYFSEFAAQARSLGAKLIGGCCGTTPTEVGAISSAIAEDRAPRGPLAVLERELAVEVAREERETRLAADLREGRFVTSVQIDPPLGANYGGLLEIAAAVHATGAYVDINDNATARVGMHPLIVAAALERRVGIETIPHLTPRDSTVMGLESVLLGAHAEGVRNLLAVTGDPPEIGDYPGSGGVYEVDSIGLTHLVSHLNRGENFNGKAIDAPTSFFAGVAVNPIADDPDEELDRFRRKIEAGARFAMTQIVFDVRQVEGLLERLGGASPVPLIAGVFPLTSYRLALRLHNEVPGIVVPDALQEALRDAGPGEREVGFAHARELLAALRDVAAGVYVVAPYRQPLSVLELLA